VERPFI